MSDVCSPHRDQPILSEPRIATLMGWAPSHQRKFSETAVNLAHRDWINRFPKETSLAALLSLLRLDGGLEAAEEICRRASIRGPSEATDRAARAALRSHGLDSRRFPRSRWAQELASRGSTIEAAWLLWLAGARLSEATAPPAWARRNPDLCALIARDPSGSADEERARANDATPDEHPQGRETSAPAAQDDLLEELRRLAARGDVRDASLPPALRALADRLDAAASAERDVAETLLRAGHASELARHVDAAAAMGDAFGSGPLISLEGFREALPSAAIEEAGIMVARAREYATAAVAWRAALDGLASTHDYAGAAELRERAVAAAAALDLPVKPTDEADYARAAETVEAGDREKGEPYDVRAASPALDLYVGDKAAAAEGEKMRTAPSADERQTSEEPAAQAGTATPTGRDTAESTRVPAPSHPAAVFSGSADPFDAGAAEGEAVAERPAALPCEPVSEAALVRGAVGEDVSTSERLAAATRRAAATAFGQERYGLALHVARAAEATGVEAPFGFDPPLLEAVVAGLSVGTPRSERAADLFEREGAYLVRQLAQAAPLSYQLLAFAAALKPALFAVEAGGNEVIAAADGISKLGAGIYRLASLAETARVGELLPADLAEHADGVAPERRLQELRDDMDRFYDDALRRRIKFQRATRIWFDLLRVGAIHDAIRAVIDGSAEAGRLVDAALSHDLADLDRLVSASDRAAIGGRKMQVLTAGARATLTDWLEDLASRLAEWRALDDAAQRRQLNQHARRVRHELREAAEAARADLATAHPSNDPALAIAFGVARAAVASLLALFEGPDTARLSLEMRRDDDLLLLPGTWSRNRTEWTGAEAEAFADEVGALPDGHGDFMAAFVRYVAEGRFPNAVQARNRIVLGDPSEREALDVRIAGERDRQMEADRRRLGQLRKRLNDLLGADDRQVLNRDLGPELDKLEAMLKGKGDPQIDLADWRERLVRIDAELDVAFRTLLGPLQEKIDRLAERGTPVDDLRKMVELKDLTTLAEHIDAYEKGGTSPGSPTELLEAFSSSILVDDPERRFDLAGLQQAIADKGGFGPVDFSQFEEGQLEAARDLLSSWRRLREFSGRDASTVLGELFAQLLNSSLSVKAGRLPTSPYELRTPTYGSRDECVAPAFGSAAEGRYDVVLVDARSIANGAELANLKAQCSASTFFVVRGRMDAAARQAFMVQVRIKGPNPACALIDEALVLFLATLPARQRSDLFALSLAMGVVQPYSNAAQQTSPEMFFGRVDELRELWDPNGSCLVYGGRQLGKTALLRQIELRHDKPDQIVIYGDQDLDGFGDGRSTTFWRWIGRKAQARGIAIGTTITRQTSEAIREEIQSWLMEDGARRLVFLIDEADAFLRREIRTGFEGASILVEVRELMRVTNRRCKFVFAGLHDVQRLARTPNSPLLHFGIPIRVGPLMGKDLFEARGMVELPMATVGYAFGRSPEEGRALVGRALSEVGYYPSLMQTFGTVLINRLNGQAATRIGNPPQLPIRITEAELNEALDDNLFRENVRVNFDKTLNLDPRYRLLAYIVLIGTQESADRADVRPGMSVAEIQRDALFWWPQGFSEDATNSAFEGLLKEMEGLGVLVGLRSGRYAIRSARIAAMLGTLHEVEDRVEELAGEPFLPSEDTGGSRRLLGLAPSPLTFRQEGVLLERRGAAPVAIALTTTALGRNSIADALKGIVEERVLLLDQRVMNVRELERTISLVASRMKQGRCGLLVANGPWLGSDAIAAAYDHPEVRRAQRNSNAGVRVLLLPSAIDWHELEGLEPGDPLGGAASVTLSTLQQGGLREWLGRRTDNNAPPAGQIERLRDATGGFPALLSRLEGRTVEALVAAAESAAETLLANPGDALALFGLDDRRLRSIASFVHNQVGVEGFDTTARDTLAELLAGEGARAPERGFDVLGSIGVIDQLAEIQPMWRLNPLIARLLDVVDR